jgi:hypothetical protein
MAVDSGVHKPFSYTPQICNLPGAMPPPPKLTPKRATPRQGTSYMAYAAEPPAEDDPLLCFAPVPHVAPRRNSITADKQRRFIATLAATGIVTQAAKSIGVSMEAIYKLRQRPGAEGFRAAWEGALDRGIARLEDCALQRAIEGEERMVVSGGKVLGTERRFNNALLIFLLRQRMPARYSADMVPRASLKPGGALYEEIKRQVLDEEYGDEQEVFDSIDKFIDDMRVRRAANAAILADLSGGEEDE